MKKTLLIGCLLVITVAALVFAIYTYKKPQTYYDNIAQRELDLIAAVKSDDIAKTKQLLADGANVNVQVDVSQPHMGYNPLGIAIRNNSLIMAKLLIDAGADVNSAIDTNGIQDSAHASPEDNVRNNTLLSYAVILNNPQMVRLLLEHGADVNKADPIFKLWTPLRIARYNDHKEIEKILIDAGA